MLYKVEKSFKDIEKKTIVKTFNSTDWIGIKTQNSVLFVFIGDSQYSIITDYMNVSPAVLKELDLAFGLVSTEIKMTQTTR